MGTEVKLETKLLGSLLNKSGTYYVPDNETRVFHMSLVGGPTIVQDHCDINHPELGLENYTFVDNPNNPSHAVPLGQSITLFEGTGGEITVTPKGPTVKV